MSSKYSRLHPAQPFSPDATDEVLRQRSYWMFDDTQDMADEYRQQCLDETGW